MISLSDSEEILAVLIAAAIIMGFIFSTLKEIKSTIAEEKDKFQDKKEAEEKVKTLIDYLDAKTRLISSIKKAQKKLKKKEDK